ncbi:MAG: nucleotidyltransferase family protein [Lautropia sp.]
MKAIVLAGGLGNRLRSRVPDLPKPMAPVAGRPFLEHVLDPLVAAGIGPIVLSVGYRAESIRDHFGQAYRGAALAYAVETEPLGTGGAIALAGAATPDEPCLVVNGDTYLDVDFAAVVDWYRQSPERFAMVLTRVPDVARYGAVTTVAGRVVQLHEKGGHGPGLINAGAYLLQPRVFGDFGLSGRFSLESDLLQPHCRELAPRAYVTDAFFIDIGIPEDFDRAQTLFAGGRGPAIPREVS